eukprot:3582759-Pleurochrysis_carterae.AAC.1
MLALIRALGLLLLAQAHVALDPEGERTAVAAADRPRHLTKRVLRQLSRRAQRYGLDASCAQRRTHRGAAVRRNASGSRGDEKQRASIEAGSQLNKRLQAPATQDALRG